MIIGQFWKDYTPNIFMSKIKNPEFPTLVTVLFTGSLLNRKENIHWHEINRQTRYRKSHQRIAVIQISLKRSKSPARKPFRSRYEGHLTILDFGLCTTPARFQNELKVYSPITKRNILEVHSNHVVSEKQKKSRSTVIHGCTWFDIKGDQMFSFCV